MSEALDRCTLELERHHATHRVRDELMRHPPRDEHTMTLARLTAAPLASHHSEVTG